MDAVGLRFWCNGSDLFPAPRFPRTFYSSLDIGHSQRLGKARFRQFSLGDRFQEFVGFDDFEVIVSQSGSDGRIEVRVVGVFRPAQNARIASLCALPTERESCNSFIRSKSHVKEPRVPCASKAI